MIFNWIKKSWPHQGVRNVLLAFLKDMEETDHFLARQEAEILYAALFLPKYLFPGEKKSQRLLQEVRNVLLASFKDMEETHHFLVS